MIATAAWTRMLCQGLLLACVLAVPSPANAETPAPPLRGEWRAINGEAQWQAFDPQRLARIPTGDHGAQLRLFVAPLADGRVQRDAGPATGHASASAHQLVLVVHAGPLHRLRWSDASGAFIEAGLMDVQRQGWLGHGRIGIPLATLPLPDAPFHLALLPQPGIASSVAFALAPQDRFVAEEVRWVALVSVCLALLAGMALVALVFAARLRDATFLWYAAYLASFAVVQVLQTGYAASPLGWSLLVEAPRAWGRMAVVVSIVSIVLFLVRFAELRRYAPRSVRPLHAYAAAVALSALLAWVPVPAVQAAASAAINPLLILGGPLLLGVALRAWWRGARYAGFFVVGWAPLLLVTGAGSLQLFGVLGGWMDNGQAPLLAAAFEALVLSAGLADRIALVRRDRDIARALADVDPLTGVLNRRALDAQLQHLSRSAPGTALALLYCDLDHFKRLNDSSGHAAGDEALRAVALALSAELRPRDAIGRMGGEEFVIVLPDCSASAAVALAQRLCAKVRALGQPPRFGSAALTISIGVAVGAAEHAASLLERADRALYAAKSAGRDRVVLHEA